MKRIATPLLIIVALLFRAVSAMAEPSCTPAALERLRLHTFRLIVTREDGTTIQQTAFRIAGHAGLYTALHGVIGATSINADREDAEIGGKKIFESYTEVTKNPLIISRIDKASDLAFLEPSDGVWPAKGFDQFQNAGLEYGGNRIDGEDNTAVRKRMLCLMGHPRSTPELIEQPLTVRERTVKLEELVGASTSDLTALYTFLITTKSPDVHRTVLSLAGTIRPGDSGAPLVDETGRVVAVANGGRGEELNWAIPLSPSCFFRVPSCTRSGLTSEELRSIQTASQALAKATQKHHFFEGSVLRLPLPLGTKINGPQAHLAIGPYHEIKASAEFADCDALNVHIEMSNLDPVFGYCVRPRLFLVGKNPAEPVEVVPLFGRLCLGSVLEDETILRIWDIVAGKPKSDLIRQILRIDGERLAKLEETHKSICERRKENECKPYRASPGNPIVPAFVTDRVDEKSFKPPIPVCDKKGSSELYEIRWEYNPDLKPEGVFEALDDVEMWLRNLDEIGEILPITDAIAKAKATCGDASTDACLPDILRALAFDANNHDCRLQGDGGKLLCHLIMGL